METALVVLAVGLVLVLGQPLVGRGIITALERQMSSADRRHSRRRPAAAVGRSTYIAPASPSLRSTLIAGSAAYLVAAVIWTLIGYADGSSWTHSVEDGAVYGLCYVVVISTVKAVKRRRQTTIRR